MRLYITGKTNCKMPYIDTIAFQTKYGILTIDRNETLYEYDRNTGVMQMLWEECYIWDGQKENYEILDDILDGASCVEVSVDDDADEKYFFQLTDCEVCE